MDWGNNNAPSTAYLGYFWSAGLINHQVPHDLSKLDKAKF